MKKLNTFLFTFAHSEICSSPGEIFSYLKFHRASVAFHVACFCLLPFALFSQAPQGFNYQAVARDSDNAVLANTALDVKIGLLQGSETGTLVWEEIHLVTTNDMGLFTLKIGDTTATNSGGSAVTFSDIDWATGSYYLEVQVDDGGGYVELGSTELLSVPYALYAEEGNEGPAGPQGLQGDQGPQGIQGTQGVQGPTGTTGPQGPAGTGLNNQGSWSVDSTYYEGDYVFDRSTTDPLINSMWIFQGTPPFTSSTQPYLDSDNWVEFEAPEGPEGQEGPQGAQGPQGLQGTQGEQGIQGEQGVSGDPATDDQTLSIAGYELTISGGNMVTLPDSVIDDDADPTNEIQDISIDGFNLSITDGSTVILPDNVNDADYDPANELQILSISSDTIYLSSGGYVVLPEDEDPDSTNEIQDLQLTGNDLTITKNATATTIDLSNANYWTKNEDTVYVTGTNVGIGTSSPGGRLQVLGETTDDEEPLFEVKNKDGQTVFAVYNNGVRVYVDDSGTKGLKGGFAVGGFSSSKGAGDYMMISPDSIRFYIDTSSVKGLKGGFAVGGYSSSKGPGQEYMRITGDSVRIYIDRDIGKGLKGGFAVGGYSSSKGTGNEYFRVTPDSVRIYLDTSNVKGLKGGFAVGGYSSSKGPGQEYMRVTGDSVRIYVDRDIGKGLKGGFAVGGYSSSKGINQEYLRVTPDSVRIYIDTLTTKGLKGGFAVGGYSSSKGIIRDLLRVTIDSTRIYVNDSTAGFGISNMQSGLSQSFLDLTTENYFIGHESGIFTKPGSGDIGKYNSFIGYQSGHLNEIGKKNVFIGHQSGYSNKASYNVFIGNESGKSNDDGGYNLFMGYRSGLNNVSGDGNIFIGYQSGRDNLEGHNNIFLGYNSGMKNTEADNNIFIGLGSGYNNYKGNYNLYLGHQAGYYDTTGNNNVFIGYRSGRNNRNGSGNVFIGYKAGYNELGSDKLYIDNSDVATPLIWGDFSTGNEEVIINGDFYVTGSAGGSGPWSSKSDRYLKNNIATIPDALNKVLKLRGVNFNWKNPEEFEGGRKIGFIAQEMNKIIPEVVNKIGEYYSIQYAPMTALLVEALKEQQRIISKQQDIINSVQEQNSNLKQDNEKIKFDVERIKTILGITAEK